MSIPALERDYALDVFSRLHVMELKPVVRGGHRRPEDEMFAIAKGMLATPDTRSRNTSTPSRPPNGSEMASREYFQPLRRAAVPVLPIPAHDTGSTEFMVER